MIHNQQQSKGIESLQLGVVLGSVSRSANFPNKVPN